MKIRPVGAEFFYVDGQTDGRTDTHDEADSRLSQFCARVWTLDRRKAVSSKEQNNIESVLGVG
jgi:hypothetical protein